MINFVAYNVNFHTKNCDEIKFDTSVKEDEKKTLEWVEN